MKPHQIILSSFALASAATAQEISITRAESHVPYTAPAENFTGKVRIEYLFGSEEPARVSGGLVNFEAGARTAWHSHPLGQTLILTAGSGRVQQWNEPVQEMRKGDIVRIPPNVKHWHGASPEAAMSHIAIGERLDGRSVEWMEKVSDVEFQAPPQGQAKSEETSGPSRAQQLMGIITPKLAELTDDVLYADVWERPQLSKRDRSLATVSALIAMNRPDQLRSHLGLAVRNGVTEEELSEVITHLAFYAGWPSSVTAAVLAKEEFKNSQIPTPSSSESEEQELISLSEKKWTMMANKDVDALDNLFHEESKFVHMGGTWGKSKEIDVIQSGEIWYKEADIYDVSVNLIGDTAVLLNRIKLLAEVGGNEVTNPFEVTEVYVKEDNEWKLLSLSFTRLLSPNNE